MTVKTWTSNYDRAAIDNSLFMHIAFTRVTAIANNSLFQFRRANYDRARILGDIRPRHHARLRMRDQKTVQLQMGRP